jgi:hypothetical protein
MNPHPSHKITRLKAVDIEIMYCDYCSLFATHREIEQPCRCRPDLLARLKRLETLNRESCYLKGSQLRS